MSIACALEVGAVGARWMAPGVHCSSRARFKPAFRHSNYRASEALKLIAAHEAEIPHRIRGTVSIGEFLSAGRYAARSQVAAGFHHNGGVAGFGDMLAGSATRSSAVTLRMILPSLLDDPRYFRLRSGSLAPNARWLHEFCHTQG
jgi:hypothetical protein